MINLGDYRRFGTVLNNIIFKFYIHYKEHLNNFSTIQNNSKTKIQKAKFYTWF